MLGQPAWNGYLVATVDKPQSTDQTVQCIQQSIQIWTYGSTRFAIRLYYMHYTHGRRIHRMYSCMKYMHLPIVIVVIISIHPSLPLKTIKSYWKKRFHDGQAALFFPRSLDLNTCGMSSHSIHRLLSHFIFRFFQYILLCICYWVRSTFLCLCVMHRAQCTAWTYVSNLLFYYYIPYECKPFFFSLLLRRFRFLYRLSWA